MPRDNPAWAHDQRRLPLLDLPSAAAHFVDLRLTALRQLDLIMIEEGSAPFAKYADAHTSVSF